MTNIHYKTYAAYKIKKKIQTEFSLNAIVMNQTSNHFLKGSNLLNLYQCIIVVIYS